MKNNIRRYRLFGGDDLLVYFNGNIHSLGHLITGTLTDKTVTQEITFADGNTLDLDGKRSVNLNLTVAQTTKEELELVDSLRGKKFPLFYNNGLVDSQNQIYFFPEAEIKPTITLKSPDNPKNIVLEIKVNPLNSKVELENDAHIVPHTLLPKIPTQAVSDNNFYLLTKKTP